MTYCTSQDLVDRFGESELIQRTDRDNTGSIDYAVLDQAIADATADINGYLTAYLPLANVPANLVRIACDLTRYYLYDDQIIEPVQARYDACIKYLNAVAKGQISLPPDTAGVPPTVSTDSVSFSSETAVFSRSALDGF